MKPKKKIKKPSASALRKDWYGKMDEQYKYSDVRNELYKWRKDFK